MIYIYVLLDESGRIFYVGQTEGPNRRLKEHQIIYGPNITMKIIQKVIGPLVANDQEDAWIKFYDHYCQLKNIRRRKE